MRKNIFLILLVAAIFVFVGTVYQSAKAVDDPVQFIKNAKTPVHFHSLAGGDSLVHNLPTMVGTWWHSIYPSNTFDAFWKVKSQIDNGTPGLNPSDKLKMGFYTSYPPGTLGDSLWVHVEEVTITLILTKEPAHLDTMYVEYTAGYDSLLYPITHPISTWWHEIWPEYSRIYQLTSWTDIVTPGQLSYCDTIDITEWWHVTGVFADTLAGPPDTGLFLIMEDRDGEGEDRTLRFSGGLAPDSVYRATHTPVNTWWHEYAPHWCNWWQIHSWTDNGNGVLDSCDIIDFVTYWHVEDVAIDIEVLSIPDPTVPTMTQWGLIVLVLLLIASAVFVGLRRRKAAVPA